jgi:hypothetical protein
MICNFSDNPKPVPTLTYCWDVTYFSFKNVLRLWVIFQWNEFERNVSFKAEFYHSNRTFCFHKHQKSEFEKLIRLFYENQTLFWKVPETKFPSCVFKVSTLISSNQSNYFENATACSKGTLKTIVAMQLYFHCQIGLGNFSK